MNKEKFKIMLKKVDSIIKQDNLVGMLFIVLGIIFVIPKDFIFFVAGLICIIFGLLLILRQYFHISKKGIYFLLFVALVLLIVLIWVYFTQIGWDCRDNMNYIPRRASQWEWDKCAWWEWFKEMPRR